MNYSGLVECTLKNGKTRTFKFGMAASAKFCELQNIPWARLDEAFTELSPQTLINAYYAAALAYDNYHKIKVDYDDNDVAHWIDEIGVDVLSLKLLEALIPPKAAISPAKKKPVKKRSRSSVMSTH